MCWVYMCFSLYNRWGWGRALPKQLIGQPPPRPLGMPVFLVPHFIETTPRLRIRKPAGENICREIVHSTRANTRDFTRFAIHVNFLVGVRRRFYNDANLFRYFSRIICDMIRRRRLHGERSLGCGIYIDIYIYTPTIIK